MVKQVNKVKQISEKDIFKKAEGSLEAALLDIPFIKLKGFRRNVRIDNRAVDFVLSILISGKPYKFIVEVKSQGEPRFIRMAIAQIKGYLQDDKNSYGVVVAPYLSDAARRICNESGLGCVDLAGNAFLSFKGIFIDRSGAPNPFSVSRRSKSVFSPKSSRILRILLSDPSKGWFVEDISKEAGISIGLTSRIKQRLLAEEWIKEENKRFHLVKPDEMFNQWVRNYSYTKNQSFSYYSGLSEDQLGMAIKNECDKRGWPYGLALFSGARKVAPFVRFLKFFAYIGGDIKDIADSLQLKKVETGANVTLLSPYDDGVFYGLQDIDGIKVVSDIQLYLDLKDYKGRGEEAAKALFEQRIKPKW